jgi:membrane protein implicated in regulation of membrane protease activity
VFVLWPLYTPVGSLYANLSDGLTLPFEATYGFVLVLGAAIVAIIVAARWVRGRRSPDGGRAWGHA